MPPPDLSTAQAVAPKDLYTTVFDPDNVNANNNAQLAMYNYGLDDGGTFGNLNANGGPGRVAQTNSSVDPYWQAIMRQQANAAPRANPYDMAMAGQTNAAQAALFNQMRAQQAGPSVAGMQTAGAMGNSLQSALRANGPNNLVAQQAQGVAGQVGAAGGQAALAEQMQSSAAQGNLASGMRSRNQQAELQQMQAALQARSLDNANQQFYSGHGAALQQAQTQARIEQIKLFQRLAAQKAAQDAKTRSDIINGIGAVGSTVFGAIAKGG